MNAAARSQSRFIRRARWPAPLSIGPRLGLLAMLITVLAAGVPRPAPAQTQPPAESGAPAAPRPADSGSWITPVPKDTPRNFPAVGSFRARQSTRLGLQVGGRVEKVLVDVGDIVKANQELVKLDPEFFEIEVVQRKADLDSAKIAVQEAELNLNRMKGLFDKPPGEAPSVARKQLDDAQAAYDSAQARLRAGEGAMRFAEKRLRESVVRAPYNAVVSKRLVDPGEPITSAPISYVLEVQEVDTLDLEFSLPQDMLSRVKKGTLLSYEVDGVPQGGKGTTTINVIYPSLDEATRSFRCRALVSNKDLRLKPGMLAQVQVLEREGSGTVVVPRNALQQTAYGWQVKVNENGRSVLRAVKVGLLTDREAEIQQGLRPGDRVWVPST